MSIRAVFIIGGVVSCALALGAACSSSAPAGTGGASSSGTTVTGGSGETYCYLNQMGSNACGVYPASFPQSEVASECAALGGQPGQCPMSGVIGCCKQSVSGSPQYDYYICYYPTDGGADAGTYQMSCTQGGNMWTSTSTLP